VKLDLHDNDYGFDLTFIFEKNSYFNQTELKKSFFCKHPQSCEKAVGTEIQWKDASCDVTKTKKKKGKGKKKVNVVVKCDSFFNFFNTVEEDTSAADKDSDDENEDADDPNSDLQHDLELGSNIRDDLVPLALEFYLGVVEQDSDDDFDDMDDDDDEEDDDAKPVKPKGKKKGAKGDGDDAKKQEECKQQ